MIDFSTTENGFSAVELLATILIGALFLLAFYQLYNATLRGNAVAKQESIASDIAYSNLREYTTRPSFTCNTTTDLTANANAPGQVLYDNTTNNPAQLPGPLVETVKVYAPRGCDMAYPVKIESIARYGNPARTIVHSTYVN